MIKITDDNKTRCSGCSACAHACPVGCIAMERDSEGFLYPVADAAQCINCGKCDRICPVTHREAVTHTPDTACIVRNNDADVLRRSTSGGAVTAVSEVILAQGGIVFGGALDGDFHAVHRSAETPDMLRQFQNSKYVQSDVADAFPRVKQELESGRQVMFAGTPCQTAGLKRYLGKDYDNLFTVDFVCRAVPSPKVWEQYKTELEQRYHAQVTEVYFREKTYGYHSSNLAVTFGNGKKHVENAFTDSYLKAFFEGLSIRPSCTDCAFRRADRVSDLTVFDCWNITRYVPDVADDDKGYTAVIVQSAKGQKMLEAIGKATTQYPASLDELLAHCGHMALQNPPENPKRAAFFEQLSEGKPLTAIMRTLSPVKASRKAFAKLKKPLYKLGLLGKLKQ